MDVLVAGGSGFIGRAVCRVLHERGHDVTALSRSPDGTLPAGIETVSVDITLGPPADVVAGHDAVVNLVALPSHREPTDQSHRAVHYGGTRNLVAASEQTDVERFVQMSALGVDSGVETAYFDAKRRAERTVRASGLDWVLFRPSVVFGDDCAFIPFIERVTPPLVAALPGGGKMRIQPLWVGDLAPMLVDGVTDQRHVGECYELGGPEKLTLAETVEQITGKSVVSIPMWLADAGFSLVDLVPGLPFGRDQSKVFALDNTITDNDVRAFGVTEAELRTLGTYLAHRHE